MSTIVASTTQLLAVLSSSHAGDTILLAPGSYSAIVINGFESRNVSGVSGLPAPVTITSEFSSAEAVLSDVEVASSTGLSFSNLSVSTANLPNGSSEPNYNHDFEILSSSRINVSGLSIFGSPLGTATTAASGMLIENSSNVQIAGSSFAYLHNGITQGGNDGVTIESNTFSYMDTDGIDGGGSSNVLITKNAFSSQHMDLSNLEHPDAIQFWTAGFSTSSKNITITDNTMTRGMGNPVQGIFLKDEVGNLPYYNVTIAGNQMMGESTNGIYAEDVRSTEIKDNTLTSYPDVQSYIRVLSSSGVVASGNYADGYGYYDSSVTSSNNTTTNSSSAPIGTFDADDEAGMVFVSLPSGPFISAPEPSTWTLMILGFGWLGLAFRRHRGITARA